MKGFENSFCDAAGLYGAVQSNRPAISMRTFVLPESGSRRDQTNVPLGRHAKFTGSSRTGRVLAKRHRILKGIDPDGVEANELTLDQTVTVTQAIPTGQRGGVGALQSRGHSAALCKTSDVIRGFNRDTHRLAAQVLGAVGFAILVLGMLTRERDPEAVDLRGNESLTSRDLLANVNPPVLSKVDGLKEKSSTDELASKLTTRDRLAFTEISPDESSSTRTETLESAQIGVPALNQPSGWANANSRSSSYARGSARVIRSKIHNTNHRSPVRPRFVDVKTRLIALWHQSLPSSQQSRCRAGFRDPNEGQRKRILYAGQNEPSALGTSALN